MTSKITLFNHFAQKLIDFTDIPSTPRSWIMNGYGKFEFSIGYDPEQSQADQLLQEKYFQFGNLIHIEHIPQIDENGNKKGQLPSWTGILLPEQSWDDGVAHFTAYSAECILVFRAMPYISVKGTPKVLMQQMINIVHERANNIIFQPGVLDDVPSTFPDDLRTNAYDHIQKLVKNSRMDWDVTGDINPNGNLDLYINLYNRKGIDTNLELTNMNAELQSPLLSIQGTPSNQVFGYSQAQTKQSRYGSEYIHQGSYDDYGPLQLNQVYVGIHDPAGTDNATKARAEERGRPVMRIGRTALDYYDTFNYMNTGNTVLVKDHRVGFHPDGGYGFEKTMQIISMSYNDLSNKLPITIEAI